MIYHITTQSAWTQSEANSYHPPSFAEEGFVHCSDFQQVERSANKYYQAQVDLLLLAIDPTRLDAETRYENLLGGAEKFPHVYGAINKSAIQRVIELGWSAQGALLFSAPPNSADSPA